MGCVSSRPATPETQPATKSSTLSAMMTLYLLSHGRAGSTHPLISGAWEGCLLIVALQRSDDVRDVGEADGGATLELRTVPGHEFAARLARGGAAFATFIVDAKPGAAQRFTVPDPI